MHGIIGAFERAVVARFEHLSSGAPWNSLQVNDNAPEPDLATTSLYTSAADLIRSVFQGNFHWGDRSADVQTMPVAPDALGARGEASQQDVVPESGGGAGMAAGTRYGIGTLGTSQWQDGTLLTSAVLGYEPPTAGQDQTSHMHALLEPVDGAMRIELFARFDDLAGRSDQALFALGEGTETELRLAQVGRSDDVVLSLETADGSWQVVASDVLIEGRIAHWAAGVGPDGLLWLEMDGTRLGSVSAGRIGRIEADTMDLGRSSDGDPLDGVLSHVSVISVPLPETTGTNAPDIRDTVSSPGPDIPEVPDTPHMAEPGQSDTAAPPADPETGPSPEPEVPGQPPVAPPPTPQSGAGDMIVVAHQDDDLLFMNPTIAGLIAGPAPVTAIYLTAGDAGRDETYWSGRELGQKHAYAEMAGSDVSDWVDETVQLTVNAQQYQIASSYLSDDPDVRLYFLRLPDGFGAGHGSERYGNQSLEHLLDGDIDQITAVDGSATYTVHQLTAVMTALIDLHGPERLHIQDHTSDHAGIEHSDHLATAEFASVAAAAATDPLSVISYHGYATWGFEENLTEAEHALVREVFLEYAAYDPLVFGSDGDLIESYEEWVQREYVADTYFTDDPDGSTLIASLMRPDVSSDDYATSEPQTEAAEDPETDWTSA